MTKIVIDTNMLVSAILTPEGNPAKILNLVLEGNADFIISGDHHLTDLKIFQSIKIIDPAAFLKIVNIQ